MRIKQITPNKIICSLLFAICLFALCLFISCEQPANSGGDDEYNNPNAGASRDGLFSHNSGLYNQQSISLTLKAPEGSTVYYSTDGSIPSPEKVDNKVVFKYTSPITIQNRNGQANVLATSANSTQMYMVANDPRGSVPQVYTPTAAQVPKATVIRAIIVDEKGKKSDVITKTYFFGNNLANYASHPVISIVTDPSNLVDRDYGILVRGATSNRWDSPPAPDVYNFLKKGIDWEREAYFELFEGGANSRSVPLSTGVGIRVRGGWSRGAGQKSFTVYFREEYGINNLRNYNLIPGAVKADGTPVARYKSFMLRNGANDGEYTKFYDVFIQDLLKDRSFTSQAGVPCIVYLNGEYWGPYNLQERYSDNHTEYKYGVAKENVISYDNGELDDGTQADLTLYNQMMNMRNRDMSNTANYNAFCALFDIDNFVDYWAAEIYIYNEDWPHNNYRVWRARNSEQGNPYGDTKWRYQMFDTEFALGIYNGGGLTGQSGKNAFDEILSGSDKDHPNNQLFKALLANENFCRKFVSTMMDLYNVNFHPDTFGPLLDKYAAVYRPLMGDNNTNGSYFSRWGGWPGQFQNKVNEARKYLNDIRGAMINNYLPRYFGGYSGIANIGISSNNLHDVTISATGASGVSIKINTVTPNLAGSWTGKYYSGNPITVTASAAPSGYEFDGWTVTGGTAATPSALTTTVDITGNMQITAKYKQTGVAVVHATGITLNRTTLSLDNGTPDFNLIAAVTPSDATYKTVSWESSNYGVANVDSSGKVSAVKSGTATITASTVNGVSATCAVTVEYNPVLLDLTEILQTMTPGTIDSRNDFNAAFGNILSTVGTVGTDATYKIIDEGGVKKLRIDEFAMWGVGFDIKDLQAGDIVEVKGRYLGGPGNGMQIITNSSGSWDYSNAIKWLGLSAGQSFHETFTIAANGDIRIRTNGKDPWAGPGGSGYIPGYVDSFVIEQVKVSRN
jgi:hypothetical protein